MKRFLSIYIPLVALAMATSIGFAACGPKLPPNTSLEGKLAVRGNQLVQAMRASIPTVKTLTCTPQTPQAAIPTCISPASAVKVFEGMEKAFGYSEQAADALRALDNAKTAQEQEVAKTKALQLLDLIQKTLIGVTVTPETEGARNALVQALQGVMSILIAIGSFGTV